jgi:exonuclease SbcC
MKILNIYFKNINSLEGESRIDFTQAPFSDTGVFAITGPNGSGKSSILDAITLGLYGETFRFDRPAKHVMTKHAAECFSVIEFALGAQKYRSSWLVKREGDAADGELVAAVMSLINLENGDVLAETPQQVCARITELTGMNFRNFTRSILLAQGDFAAFLNALDSERMDILEKIISTDIYADYKNEVLSNAEQAKQQLQRLQQELSEFPLLSAEKLDACEHDLNDFSEQSAELHDLQRHLQQQQVMLQNYTLVKTQLDTQESQLWEVNVELAAVAELLQQLSDEQEALVFKEDVESIAAKIQVIEHDKQTLAGFRDELEQLKSRIGKGQSMPEQGFKKSIDEQRLAISEIKNQCALLSSQRQSESNLERSLSAQQNDRQSALGAVSLWLNEHAAEEMLLDNFPETGRLKTLRNELIDLKDKQKSSGKWTKNTQAGLKNNKVALEQEHKKIADLNLQLQLAEKDLESLAQGNTLETIEDLQQEQKQRFENFQELNTLAQSYEKLTGGAPGLFSRFKKPHIEHDVIDLRLELDNLRQQIIREENIVLVLETGVFQESLLKKLAPDRSHLVDGKPCPLCGAGDHPYANSPPMPGNSQQALVDQRQFVKELTVKAGILERNLSAAQQQVEKNQATQTQLQLISSKWLMLCNRLNTVSDDLEINNLKLMKELLKIEADKLTEIGSLVSKYRSKFNTIEKLKITITNSTTKLEQLQAAAEQLEAQWKGRPDKVDYDAALVTCQQEEKVLLAKLTEQLTLLGEKMPAKGKEDALYDKLNVRRQEYQGYIIRRNDLNEEIEALVDKQKHCQEEVISCSEKLDRYSAQLDAEEYVGLHLALLEKQKLILEKDQWLAQQQAELVALQQSLREKLQGTRFASFDELSQMLAAMQNRPELEQRLTTLQQDVTARTVGLDNLRAQLDAASAGIDFQLNPEQINVQIKETLEKIELAEMDIKRLNKIINEQGLLQQQHDGLTLELQNQQDITQRCLGEVEFVQQESGMDFRRRVQSRVIEQLLSQTNAVLEKVSGRYYLRQANSGQGLALEVEDTFQGNVRRLPKTLSGGESFVVSLALALGLSELANNGKSVDSLFLDEGFGNLDAESLYTVISTLEGLRTHGKTVGVISHVEGVQKRFKAQLQVIKKPNGLGMLQQAT